MDREFSTLIIDATNSLTRKVDEDGRYLHVQVSFSDFHRLYISLCPILDNDQLFLWHEYDLEVGEHLVSSKSRFKGYISSYANPDFIGIREDPQSENLRILYVKEDLVQLPQKGMGLSHVSKDMLGQK